METENITITKLRKHLTPFLEFINRFHQENKELKIFPTSFVKEFQKVFYDFYITNSYEMVFIDEFQSGKRREEDLHSSSLLYFYYFVIYSLHFPNHIDLFREFGRFSLIYVLIDPFIDDPNIDKATKLKGCKQLEILMDEPQKRFEMDIVDPVIFEATELYEKTLIKIPLLKPYLKEFFIHQINGYFVQSRDDLEEKDYRQACYNKGSSCSKIMLAFICAANDIDIEKEGKMLAEWGDLGQLVDDCCDVKDDMEKGINTTATYHYRKYGNLDRLILDAVEKLLKSSNYYFFCNLSIWIGIFYCICLNTEYYSKELIKIIEPYYDIHEHWLGKLNKTITLSLELRIKDLLNGKR